VLCEAAGDIYVTADGSTALGISAEDLISQATVGEQRIQFHHFYTERCSTAVKKHHS